MDRPKIFPFLDLLFNQLNHPISLCFSNEQLLNLSSTGSSKHAFIWWNKRLFCWSNLTNNEELNFYLDRPKIICFLNVLPVFTIFRKVYCFFIHDLCNQLNHPISLCFSNEIEMKWRFTLLNWIMKTCVYMMEQTPFLLIKSDRWWGIPFLFGQTQNITFLNVPPGFTTFGKVYCFFIHNPLNQLNHLISLSFGNEQQIKIYSIEFWALF